MLSAFVSCPAFNEASGTSARFPQVDATRVEASSPPYVVVLTSIRTAPSPSVRLLARPRWTKTPGQAKEARFRNLGIHANERAKIVLERVRARPDSGMTGRKGSGRMPTSGPADHRAVLYGSPEELERNALPFVEQGLARGEAVLAAVSSSEGKALTDHLG